MKYQLLSFLLLVLFSNTIYATNLCENEQVLNELKEEINFSFSENLKKYLDHRNNLRQKFVKVLLDKSIDEMRALPFTQADSQKIRQEVIQIFQSINQRFDHILSEYVSDKISGSKLKPEYHIFIEILEEENSFEVNQQYEKILKIVNEAKSLHQHRLFIAQLNNDSATYEDELFSFNDYDLIDLMIEKYLDFSLFDIQLVNKQNIVGAKFYHCNSTLLLQSKPFSLQFSMVDDQLSHLESKIDNKPISNKKLGDYLIKGSKAAF
ncbi:hypothetical protein [Acinetobacter haemolyticus]|uniref:hypothetical protein n=1 Tax=Acinetobacter haemolyticus TaxID=29430 RepID=UPI000E18E5CB|nr:hypothetical protein [Acinetobacter haemolyticus]NAR99984.1 hypothetical protein [Acinetobacter haemolyticus]SUU24284.1 Uncharacterised protein [Acinetobacter haemolyticus]